MAFGTAKASVVTINGVNMANYLLEWTAKGTISQDFGTGTLKLIRSVLDDFPDDIANGKTVIIKRGGTDGTETVIFRGRIEKLDQEGEKDRKSTRLNSSHSQISYAVFCFKQ